MNASLSISGSHRGAAMSRRVGEFVERLMHFDKDQIRLLSCTDGAIPIHVVQTYEAEFGTSDEEGPGALPADSARVSGPAELAAELAAMTARAEEAAADRLADWDEAQGSDPCAAPQVGDVFTRANPVGYDTACGDCKGAGQHTCGACDASGTLTCENCGGTGQTSCRSCQGRRETVCSACGGHGGTNRQVERAGWNSATNQRTVTYEAVWEACSRCSGSRTTTCSGCHGSGRTNCAHCLGAGSKTCERCNGQGSNTCARCRGQGELHRIGSVSCKIGASLSVELETEVDEIRSDLASLRDVDRILSLVEDYETESTVDDLVLRRHLWADIAVASADFEVGERRLTIHGYGPDCEIFDYRDIGGALLSDDVEMLESALSKRRGLLPALAQVLRSEAHVEIARHSVPSAKRRSAALGELSNRLQGFASSDHIARVSAAVRKGLSRAYRGRLLRGPVFLLATPLLALPANWVAWSGHFRNHDLAFIVGVMLLTLAMAFAGHLWAVKRLRGLLSTHGAVDLSEVLSRTRLGRKWMILAGVVALLLTPVFGAIGRVWAGF
jgi:hypothetical protein